MRSRRDSSELTRSIRSAAVAADSSMRVTLPCIEYAHGIAAMRIVVCTPSIPQTRVTAHSLIAAVLLQPVGELTLCPFMLPCQSREASRFASLYDKARFARPTQKPESRRERGAVPWFGSGGYRR